MEPISPSRLPGAPARRHWVGRKHATLRDADSFEADENARRGPEESVRLVLYLQERLGLRRGGLRQAARSGRLVVRKGA